MIFVMTNRKGGSGKSTVGVNLAAAWAQGQRTLLLDLDEQGDASSWLGVEDTGEALADALVGRTGLETAIHATESGVDVAPAGEALGYVADTLRPDAVRRAIESVPHRGYRVIVIDCPPNLNSIVVAAWQASSHVRALVPVDGPKALRAVQRLRHAWEDAGLDPRHMRILLTRHDGRRVLDRELARQAVALHGDSVLETRIRESVIVGESAGWRRPLILHAPTHPVTEDIRRVAREVAHG